MRDKLLEFKNPYDFDGARASFLGAMRETVAWHAERCEFYAKLLKANDFSPELIRTEDDLPKIPMIHANYFKKHELLSVPREDIVVHVTSSGTTGQKSQMFFDAPSWEFGQKMIRAELDHFGFVSDEPANYILYTYEPAGENKLGTSKTDQGLLQYAPPNKCCYALRFNGASHDFDSYGVIEAFKEYEKEGLPVRIFGFPSFLYFTLRQMKAMNIKPLKLNENSMTLLGGGWKGHADKQISKTELYALTEEMLGIPEWRCRDGYGSTEHSVPYFECPRHYFHIPIYSRMFVRDFKTLEPLGFGEIGFASFVTPHLLSVPAVSVLMGDKAVMYEGSKCGCGIDAPYMEILGRAGRSAAKSCAISASELLKKESA
ncbi:MAG: hypothetical protein FWG09_04710 [Synergistaceae bacterium]|nr:hypothetical protein [Synergistaceae bacterium]